MSIKEAETVFNPSAEVVLMECNGSSHAELTPSRRTAALKLDNF